ncbi:MAG: hypothetical protein CVV27_01465 [Candidatus Melainabacteria bacterium HGW-Melainabacteria-1]|nr:MAG: hypothetical protein CVV27_01465 [Candidatus Melainabacteria bacterium HGW-Melainabacteria-1]
MKHPFTVICLTLGMGCFFNPILTEAQINASLPFVQRQGHPIKLDLPKELSEKIEQGIFAPGKTPPEQIMPWLQASESEETHLIALQFLDLGQTNSQPLMAKVLQTGSAKEISFLGQRLLRQDKVLGVNLMLQAYPLAAGETQRQALLQLLGSTKDVRAWPLLKSYYLELGKEIDFLTPQNHQDEILVINQLAQLMMSYPSEEVLKSFSPLLDGDITSQILALKTLYPLNHPPAIETLRSLLKQNAPKYHMALIQELFTKSTGKVFYDMGTRVPIFDVNAISDREIFSTLLKEFILNHNGVSNFSNHPFIEAISLSLAKNPDFASLLTPYLRRSNIKKEIKVQLFYLYFQHKKLDKSDIDFLSSTTPEELHRFVMQLSSRPEQLKPLFSELISNKHPQVIAAALQIFKDDPDALGPAKSLIHHSEEDVRTAAWSLLGIQRYPLLVSLATESLAKETSPKVKTVMLRNLLIKSPSAEQVQFAINQILASEQSDLSSMLKMVFAKSHDLSTEDQAQGIEQLSPLLQKSTELQSALLDVYLGQYYIPPASDLQAIIDTHDSRLIRQLLNLIRVVSPAWEDYGSLIAPILASKDRQLALSAVEAWNNLRYQSRDAWQEPLIQLLADESSDEYVRNKILETALQHNASQAEPYLLKLMAAQSKPSSSKNRSSINVRNVRHFSQALALLPYLNDSQVQAYGYSRFNPENLLLEIGGDEILPELKRLLPTFNEVGQIRVLRLLGKMGDRKTLDVVRPFLDASNKELQLAAREAYFQLGGKLQPDEAQRLLTTEDPDSALRWRILATSPLETVFPLLRADMRSMDAKRRVAAIHLASYLNARSLFPDMLNAMGDDLIRDYAIGCIGIAERSGTVGSIIELTDASNYHMLLKILDQKELHERTGNFGRTVQQEIGDRVDPEKVLKDFAQADQEHRENYLNIFADLLDPAWKPTLLKYWQNEHDPRLKERLLAMLGNLKVSEIQPILLARMTSNRQALTYLAYMRSPDAKEYLLKLYLEDPKSHIWTLPLLRLYQDDRIDRVFTELKHSEDPIIRQQLIDLDRYPVPVFAKFPNSWQSESIRPPSRPLEERYTFAELTEMIQYWGLDRAKERMVPLARAAKSPEQKQMAERLLATFLNASDNYPPLEAINALMELRTPAAQGRLLEFWLHSSRAEHYADTLSRVRNYLLHANLQTLRSNIQKLIPHSSADKVAELRLLQIQALGLQQNTQAALNDINQLKHDQMFRAHPARLLKLLHLQSDFLPAQNRAALLNQDAEKLLDTFTFREHSLYPDAKFNHQLRKRLAQLQTGQPASARYQLESLFLEQLSQSKISYLPAGVPLIQFMISKSWLMDNQPEQAVKHLIYGLRLMKHGAGDSSGLLNVQGLESLPFQASFSSQYEQLLKLLAADPERQAYFKEYFTYPIWYPSSLASLFNRQ